MTSQSLFGCDYFEHCLFFGKEINPTLYFLIMIICSFIIVGVLLGILKVIFPYVNIEEK